MADSLICNGRYCATDENFVSNCYYDGKSCGNDMIFKIVSEVFSPPGISLAKCILECICANAELTKVNGQCLKISSEKNGTQLQNSKVNFQFSLF